MEIQLLINPKHMFELSYEELRCKYSKFEYLDDYSYDTLIQLDEWLTMKFPEFSRKWELEMEDKMGYQQTLNQKTTVKKILMHGLGISVAAFTAYHMLKKRR